MKRKSTFAASSLVLLSLLFTAPHAFAEEVAAPNSAVEAAAAKALMNAGIKLSKSPSREEYNNSFNDIAIALARLGRTETALKAAQWMTPGNAAQTQNEVLRLSVRRSAILGDVTRAAGLIPQINNNNAKADALLTVARAYLRRNDYDAAQKVLFKVTPLVPGNFQALLYTASLFAKSGNIVVAKRLFDRARNMMIPIPDASEWGNEDKGVISRSDSAFSQIRTFNRYALHAGMVDEWQPLPERPWNIQYGLDEDSLAGLLELNEIDLAIKTAKQSSPDRIVVDLCLIAYYISAKYPDRAYSLLNQASSAVPLALALLEKISDEDSLPESKQYLDMYLASGYHQLDKEEEYQKWEQQLMQDTPPNKRPLIQLHSAIFPLYVRTRSTFPPDKLLEMNDKIQPYLRELHDKEDVFVPMQFLIHAQIAAGQLPQARGNIEFLDNFARAKIVSAKDPSGFGKAFTVAEMWKRVGNDKNCHLILQTIFNAPQKITSYSKIDRVGDFIMRGFVDEGLRFFYSLPVEGKKPPQSLIRELPFSLAMAHPDRFPNELLKAKQPYTEARYVSNFVDGLTYNLFRASRVQGIEIISIGYFK